MSAKYNLTKSFKAAFCGIKDVLILEPNFKIMVVAALIVVFLMFYFPTSRTEKAVLLTMCFSVLILETINSVIEKVLDYFNPGFDARIKVIKDLMAAVVLLVSLGATIIGWIVFSPYILRLF